jgi:hypothetical protein
VVDTKSGKPMEPVRVKIVIEGTKWVAFENEEKLTTLAPIHKDASPPPLHRTEL